MPFRAKNALPLLLGALLLLAGLGWRVYFVSDAQEALTADPRADAVDVVSLDGTWRIVEGVAGYRIDEVLFGRDVTVTGRTKDVSGTLTADGSVLTGEVVVALANVASDSAKRDAQFRGRIMDVELYPNATIAFDGSVDDLGGGDYRTQANLTVKDTTKRVTVTFSVTGAGREIEVTGSVPLRVSDWPLDPPSLPGIAVEDDMLLEFKATLRS